MRILIADDNALIRRAIRSLLSGEANCDICGEASDSITALQKARELQPDLIILDISMPGTNGLDTANVIRKEFPHVKILIISQNDAEQLLPGVLLSGANGCVDKARMSVDLLAAIKNLQISGSSVTAS